MQLCKYILLLVLFVLPLRALASFVDSTKNASICLATCCFLKIANTGYDICCNNMSCKDSVSTSPECKAITRCFNCINFSCCKLQKPSYCIENTTDPRALFTPRQKYAQYVYNCCLIKTVDTIRSCYSGMSCAQTVENFGEYKIGKAVLSTCLQNPYCKYSTLGICGCLLCIGGANAVLYSCTKSTDNNTIMYDEEE